MIRRPDPSELSEIASRLGFGFTDLELRTIHPLLGEFLSICDNIDSLDLEEEGLPLHFSKRDSGYHPSENEDPLNAFITKCQIQGADTGPLAGKTVGLKDHIAVAGIPLTLGSPFFRGYVPDFDATIVTRLLDAGATIAGKLNMDPFSMGAGGSAPSRGFGRVLNPHDHSKSPGGSSAGSGAAVASGSVDVAFGGDQGGSVRLPSSWSGIVGIKATFGLIPHTGVCGFEQSMDHVGPMTRTVDDLAVVLGCVAGADGHDPRQTSVPPPPDYAKSLDRGVDGLKIGLLAEGFSEGTEPDVDAAVREAIALLEKQGAIVTDVSVAAHAPALIPAMTLFIDNALRWYQTNFVGSLSNTYSPTAFVETVGKLKQGNAHELPLQARMFVTAATYLREHYHGRFGSRSENLRKRFRQEYDRVFENVDIIAMPTVPMKAQPFEQADSYEKAIELELTGGEVGKKLLQLTGNTMPFNYTGHPALSVPCAKSEGLPIGLQLVGPHWTETTLLQSAYVLQSSVDWDALTRVEAR